MQRNEVENAGVKERRSLPLGCAAGGGNSTFERGKSEGDGAAAARLPGDANASLMCCRFSKSSWCK